MALSAAAERIFAAWCDQACSERNISKIGYLPMTLLRVLKYLEWRTATASFSSPLDPVPHADVICLNLPSGRTEPKWRPSTHAKEVSHGFSSRCQRFGSDRHFFGRRHDAWPIGAVRDIRPPQPPEEVICRPAGRRARNSLGTSTAIRGFRLPPLTERPAWRADHRSPASQWGRRQESPEPY